MATTSVNHTPSFPIPQDGNDQFSRFELITVLQAVDTDDHSAGKGPPVKRLFSGVGGGKGSPGNAGTVYQETSAPYKTWFDDGTNWHEIVDTSIAQTLTNKTLTSPSITTPTIAGPILTNNAALQFKDHTGSAQNVLIAPTDDSLWLTPLKSGGNIYIKNFAQNASNVTIDDSGNVTALGFVKANGYRTVLQTGAADVLIESGTGTSSNSADVAVTFGTAFSGGTPVVTANAVAAYSVSHGYLVQITVASNTGFSFSVFDTNTDARVNAININWMAIGLR